MSSGGMRYKEADAVSITVNDFAANRLLKSEVGGLNHDLQHARYLCKALKSTF